MLQVCISYMYIHKDIYCCENVHTHGSILLQVCIYMYIHMDINRSTCTYAHMHGHTHRFHTYAHAHMHIHRRMYVHTHIHTHSAVGNGYKLSTIFLLTSNKFLLTHTLMTYSDIFRHIH